MTERYTLTEDQEALFVATYPNHGKVWSVAPAQACQDIADAIRDNRPKPFEVGDVVHIVHGFSGEWSRDCEVLVVVDRWERPGAVVRDGRGDIAWFALTELAQGENPND